MDPKPTPVRGILCLHGLTGTPFEVHLIAQALTAAGYVVEAPLLAGHGQDPAALETSRWTDWLASARASFDDLVARVGGEPIAVVGFSMGGLLSLELVKALPDKVAAMALLCVPIRLRWPQIAGIRLLGLVPPGLRRGRVRAIPKSRGSDVAHPDLQGKTLGLPVMPLSALETLLELMTVARGQLSAVRAPALIAHGRHDHTVPIAASIELAERLGSPVVERLWLENSFHLIGIDNDQRALIDAILRFFGAHARW